LKKASTIDSANVYSEVTLLNKQASILSQNKLAKSLKKHFSTVTWNNSVKLAPTLKQTESQFCIGSASKSLTNLIGDQLETNVKTKKNENDLDLLIKELRDNTQRLAAT
jgi:hypothetical protein